MYNGRGVSTDIVEASIRAYLDAINAALDDTAVEDGISSANIEAKRPEDAASPRSAANVLAETERSPQCQ